MSIDQEGPVRGQGRCPSRQTIERERREQDATVVALRRRLAATPSRQALILYTAA